MEKIKNVGDLKRTILQLETQQAADWPLLQEEFFKTYDSLKPINLIKNGVKSFLNPNPVEKGNLLPTSIGLAAGFITKKMIIGATHNPIKLVLGSILQMGITNIVAKNVNTIKLIGNLFKVKTKSEKLKVTIRESKADSL